LERGGFKTGKFTTKGTMFHKGNDKEKGYRFIAANLRGGGKWYILEEML